MAITQIRCAATGKIKIQNGKIEFDGEPSFSKKNTDRRPQENHERKIEFDAEPSFSKNNTDRRHKRINESRKS